jgi:DNA-directed RNA polymerase subunit RPC12/RpoP
MRDYLDIMRKHDEEVRVVEVLPSRRDDAFEWVKVNGRLGIRMKSHYTPPNCEYCGSRNITDYTCNQCGAPIK